ncbi:MAG: M20/M25/M40 family metallo-hydrolase, partial [Elusimicrobiota bacterium]
LQDTLKIAEKPVKKNFLTRYRVLLITGAGVIGAGISAVFLVSAGPLAAAIAVLVSAGIVYTLNALGREKIRKVRVIRQKDAAEKTKRDIPVTGVKKEQKPVQAAVHGSRISKMLKIIFSVFLATTLLGCNAFFTNFMKNPNPRLDRPLSYRSGKDVQDKRKIDKPVEKEKKKTIQKGPTIKDSKIPASIRKPHIKQRKPAPIKKNIPGPGLSMTDEPLSKDRDIIAGLAGKNIPFAAGFMLPGFGLMLPRKKSKKDSADDDIYTGSLSLEEVTRKGAIGKGSSAQRAETVKTGKLKAKETAIVGQMIYRFKSRVITAGVSDNARVKLIIERLEKYFARGDIVTFKAVVHGKEDYLLAFADTGRLAVSRALFSKKFSDNLDELLFHEGYAAVFGEKNYNTHRDIYNGLQRDIFGAQNPLKRKLRKYINSRNIFNKSIGLIKFALFVSPVVYMTNIMIGPILKILCAESLAYWEQYLTITVAGIPMAICYYSAILGISLIAHKILQTVLRSNLILTLALILSTHIFAGDTLKLVTMQLLGNYQNLFNTWQFGSLLGASYGFVLATIGIIAYKTANKITGITQKRLLLQIKQKKSSNMIRLTMRVLIAFMILMGGILGINRVQAYYDYFKHGDNKIWVINADEGLKKQMKDALENLPEWHTKGLHSISTYPEVTKYARGYELGPFSMIAQEWETEGDRKILYPFVTRHEVGHHVYFRRISPSLRREFNYISVHLSKERKDFPTSYAFESNKYEDFAEIYELYTSGLTYQPKDMIVAAENSEPFQKKTALVAGLFLEGDYLRVYDKKGTCKKVKVKSENGRITFAEVKRAVYEVHPGPSVSEAMDHLMIMKDIGLRSDIAPEALKKVKRTKETLWTDQAGNMQLETREIKGKLITAKFIVDDTNLPDGIWGYHFRDIDNNLVIVTSNRFQDETAYHEAIEAEWIEELKRRAGPSVPREFLDNILHTAHILASAEQVMAFWADKSKFTPFHHHLLYEKYSKKQVKDILNEDRTAHHEIIKEHLGEDAAVAVKSYEENIKKQIKYSFGTRKFRLQQVVTVIDMIRAVLEGINAKFAGLGKAERAVSENIMDFLASPGKAVLLDKFTRYDTPSETPEPVVTPSVQDILSHIDNIEGEYDEMGEHIKYCIFAIKEFIQENGRLPVTEEISEVIVQIEEATGEEYGPRENFIIYKAVLKGLVPMVDGFWEKKENRMNILLLIKAELDMGDYSDMEEDSFIQTLKDLRVYEDITRVMTVPELMGELTREENIQLILKPVLEKIYGKDGNVLAEYRELYDKLISAGGVTLEDIALSAPRSKGFAAVFSIAEKNMDSALNLVDSGLIFSIWDDDKMVKGFSTSAGMLGGFRITPSGNLILTGRWKNIFSGLCDTSGSIDLKKAVSNPSIMRIISAVGYIGEELAGVISDSVSLSSVSSDTGKTDRLVGAASIVKALYDENPELGRLLSGMIERFTADSRFSDNLDLLYQSEEGMFFLLEVHDKNGRVKEVYRNILGGLLRTDDGSMMDLGGLFGSADKITLFLCIMTAGYWSTEFATELLEGDFFGKYSAELNASRDDFLEKIELAANIAKFSPPLGLHITGEMFSELDDYIKKSSEFGGQIVYVAKHLELIADRSLRIRTKYGDIFESFTVAGTRMIDFQTVFTDWAHIRTFVTLAKMAQVNIGLAEYVAGRDILKQILKNENMANNFERVYKEISQVLDRDGKFARHPGVFKFFTDKRNGRINLRKLLSSAKEARFFKGYVNLAERNPAAANALRKSGILEKIDSYTESHVVMEYAAESLAEVMDKNGKVQEEFHDLISVFMIPGTADIDMDSLFASMSMARLLAALVRLHNIDPAAALAMSKREWNFKQDRELIGKFHEAVDIYRYPDKKYIEEMIEAVFEHHAIFEESLISVIYESKSLMDAMPGYSGEILQKTSSVLKSEKNAAENFKLIAETLPDIMRDTGIITGAGFIKEEFRDIFTDFIDNTGRFLIYEVIKKRIDTLRFVTFLKVASVDPASARALSENDIIEKYVADEESLQKDWMWASMKNTCVNCFANLAQACPALLNELIETGYIKDVAGTSPDRMQILEILTSWLSVFKEIMEKDGRLCPEYRDIFLPFVRDDGVIDFVSLVKDFSKTVTFIALIKLVGLQMEHEIQRNAAHARSLVKMPVFGEIMEDLEMAMNLLDIGDKEKLNETITPDWRIREEYREILERFSADGMLDLENVLKSAAATKTMMTLLEVSAMNVGLAENLKASPVMERVMSDETAAERLLEAHIGMEYLLKEDMKLRRFADIFEKFNDKNGRFDPIKVVGSRVADSDFRTRLVWSFFNEDFLRHAESQGLYSENDEALTEALSDFWMFKKRVNPEGIVDEKWRGLLEGYLDDSAKIDIATLLNNKKELLYLTGLILIAEGDMDLAMEAKRSGILRKMVTDTMLRKDPFRKYEDEIEYDIMKEKAENIVFYSWIIGRAAIRNPVLAGRILNDWKLSDRLMAREGMLETLYAMIEVFDKVLDKKGMVNNTYRDSMYKAGFCSSTGELYFTDRYSLGLLFKQLQRAILINERYAERLIDRGDIEYISNDARLVSRFEQVLPVLFEIADDEGRVKAPYTGFADIFASDGILDFRGILTSQSGGLVMKALFNIHSDNPELAAYLSRSGLVKELLKNDDSRVINFEKVSEYIGKVSAAGGEPLRAGLGFFTGENGSFDIGKIIASGDNAKLFRSLAEIYLKEEELGVSVLPYLNEHIGWPGLLANGAALRRFDRDWAPNIAYWYRDNPDILEAIPFIVMNFYEYWLMVIEAMDFVPFDLPLAKKFHEHVTRIKRSPPERNMFQLAYYMLCENLRVGSVDKDGFRVLFHGLLDIRDVRGYTAFLKDELAPVIERNLRNKAPWLSRLIGDWKDAVAIGTIGWETPEGKEFSVNPEGVFKKVGWIMEHFGVDRADDEDFLTGLAYAINLRFYSVSSVKKFKRGFHRNHGFDILTWNNGIYWAGFISGAVPALPSEIAHAVGFEIDPNMDMAENAELQDRFGCVLIGRRTAHLVFENAAEYVVQVNKYARAVMEKWVNGDLTPEEDEKLVAELKKILSIDRYAPLFALKEKGALATVEDALKPLSYSDIHSLGKVMAGKNVGVKNAYLRFRGEFINRTAELAQKQIDDSVGIMAFSSKGYPGLKDIVLKPYDAYAEIHEMGEKVSQDLFVHLVMVMYEARVEVNTMPFLNAKAMEWALTTAKQKDIKDWESVVKQLGKLDAATVRSWAAEFAGEDEFGVLAMDAGSARDRVGFDRALADIEAAGVATDENLLWIFWKRFAEMSGGDLVERIYETLIYMHGKRYIEIPHAKALADGIDISGISVEAVKPGNWEEIIDTVMELETGGAVVLDREFYRKVITHPGTICMRLQHRGRTIGYIAGNLLESELSAGGYPELFREDGNTGLGNTMYVNLIAVAEEYRKYGLSEILYRGFMEAAAERGAEYVSLHVRENSSPKIAKLTGVPFRVLDRFTNYMGSGENFEYAVADLDRAGFSVAPDRALFTLLKTLLVNTDSARIPFADAIEDIVLYFGHTSTENITLDIIRIARDTAGALSDMSGLGAAGLRNIVYDYLSAYYLPGASVRPAEYARTIKKLGKKLRSATSHRHVKGLRGISVNIFGGSELIPEKGDGILAMVLFDRSGKPILHLHEELLSILHERPHLISEFSKYQLSLLKKQMEGYLETAYPGFLSAEADISEELQKAYRSAGSAVKKAAAAAEKSVLDLRSVFASSVSEPDLAMRFIEALEKTPERFGVLSSGAESLVFVDRKKKFPVAKFARPDEATPAIFGIDMEQGMTHALKRGADFAVPTMRVDLGKIYELSLERVPRLIEKYGSMIPFTAITFQKEIVPLDKKLKLLARKKDRESANEVLRLLESHRRMHLSMWKKGFINLDVKFANYGVDEEGNVLLSDFGELVNRRNLRDVDIDWSVHKANKLIYELLEASWPGLIGRHRPFTEELLKAVWRKGTASLGPLSDADKDIPQDRPREIKPGYSVVEVTGEREYNHRILDPAGWTVGKLLLNMEDGETMVLSDILIQGEDRGAGAEALAATADYTLRRGISRLKIDVVQNPRIPLIINSLIENGVFDAAGTTVKTGFGEEDFKTYFFRDENDLREAAAAGRDTDLNSITAKIKGYPSGRKEYEIQFTDGPAGPELTVIRGSEAEKAELLAISNFSFVFADPFRPDRVIKIIRDYDKSTAELKPLIEKGEYDRIVQREFLMLQELAHKGLAKPPYYWGMVGGMTGYIISERVDGKPLSDIACDTATADELEALRNFIGRLRQNGYEVRDFYKRNNFRMSLTGDSPRIYIIDAGNTFRTYPDKKFYRRFLTKVGWESLTRDKKIIDMVLSDKPITARPILSPDKKAAKNLISKDVDLLKVDPEIRKDMKDGYSLRIPAGASVSDVEGWFFGDTKFMALTLVENSGYRYGSDRAKIKAIKRLQRYLARSDIEWLKEWLKVLIRVRDEAPSKPLKTRDIVLLLGKKGVFSKGQILAHSGITFNSIYLHVNLLKYVRTSLDMQALSIVLRHENNDIIRGHHRDDVRQDFFDTLIRPLWKNFIGGERWWNRVARRIDVLNSFTAAGVFVGLTFGVLVVYESLLNAAGSYLLRDALLYFDYKIFDDLVAYSTLAASAVFSGFVAMFTARVGKSLIRHLGSTRPVLAQFSRAALLFAVLMFVLKAPLSGFFEPHRYFDSVKAGQNRILALNATDWEKKQIEVVVTDIPRSHLAGFEAFLFVDNIPKAIDSYGALIDPAAVYWSRLRHSALDRSAYAYNTIQNMWHEIGHHVYRKLAAEEIAAYKKSYIESKKTKDLKEFPSKYAMDKDEEEDYPENYCLWLDDTLGLINKVSSTQYLWKRAALTAKRFMTPEGKLRVYLIGRATLVDVALDSEGNISKEELLRIGKMINEHREKIAAEQQFVVGDLDDGAGLEYYDTEIDQEKEASVEYYRKMKELESRVSAAGTGKDETASASMFGMLFGFGLFRRKREEEKEREPEKKADDHKVIKAKSDAAGILGEVSEQDALKGLGTPKWLGRLNEKLKEINNGEQLKVVNIDWDKDTQEDYKRKIMDELRNIPDGSLVYFTCRTRYKATDTETIELLVAEKNVIIEFVEETYQGEELRHVYGYRDVYEGSGSMLFQRKFTVYRKTEDIELFQIALNKDLANKKYMDDAYGVFVDSLRNIVGKDYRKYQVAADLANIASVKLFKKYFTDARQKYDVANIVEEYDNDGFIINPSIGATRWIAGIPDKSAPAAELNSVLDVDEKIILKGLKRLIGIERYEAIIRRAKKEEVSSNDMISLLTLSEGTPVRIPENGIREKKLEEAFKSLKWKKISVELPGKDYSVDKFWMYTDSLKRIDGYRMEFKYRVNGRKKSAVIGVIHNPDSIKSVEDWVDVPELPGNILIQDIAVSQLDPEKLASLILEEIAKSELLARGQSVKVAGEKAREISNTYLSQKNINPEDLQKELNQIAVSWGILLDTLSIHTGSRNESPKAEFIINYLQSLGLEYIPYNLDDPKSANLPEEEIPGVPGVITKNKEGNVYVRIYPSESQKLKDKYLLFQAHMDMVFDPKDRDWSVPVESQIVEEEEKLWLKGRDANLGIDNGAGIAAMLDLAGRTVNNAKGHCGIEFLFTVDEETGWSGALNTDTSQFKSKYLVNMDSEPKYDGSGNILVSIAGGSGFETVRIAEPKKYSPAGFKHVNSDTPALRIKIDGGMGGHSGVDINKGRLNAINGLLDLIELIPSAEPVYFSGGSGRTEIPKQAEAVLLVKDIKEAEKIIENYRVSVKKKYAEQDPGADISVTNTTLDNTILDAETIGAYNSSKGDNALADLVTEIITNKELKWGVITTLDKKGTPKSTINLGILAGNASRASASAMMRSVNQEELDRFSHQYMKALKTEEDDSAPVYNGSRDSWIALNAKEAIENITRKEFKIADWRFGFQGLLDSSVLAVQKNNRGEHFEVAIIGAHYENPHTKEEKLNTSTYMQFVQWPLEIAELYTKEALKDVKDTAIGSGDSQVSLGGAVDIEIKPAAVVEAAEVKRVRPVFIVGLMVSLAAGVYALVHRGLIATGYDRLAGLYGTDVLTKAGVILGAFTVLLALFGLGLLVRRSNERKYAAIQEEPAVTVPVMLEDAEKIKERAVKILEEEGIRVRGAEITGLMTERGIGRYDAEEETAYVTGKELEKVYGSRGVGQILPETSDYAKVITKDGRLGHRKVVDTLGIISRNREASRMAAVMSGLSDRGEPGRVMLMNDGDVREFVRNEWVMWFDRTEELEVSLGKLAES